MELYVLFQEQPRTEKKPVEITPRQAELDSLLPSYSKRLKMRGWTKERLYREYVTTSKDPFARSQFMALFRNYEIQSNSVAHVDHKAGDKMFFDYAGDKTVADAILDRLVHNALRIELHGESLRKLLSMK